MLRGGQERTAGSRWAKPSLVVAAGVVVTACPREEGKLKACGALGPGLAMGVLVVREERKEET